MPEQSDHELIGGPFEGARVPRRSNSLLLTGEGVPEGQVARYRWLDADQTYVFMGLDTIVAQVPMPESRL